MCVWRERNLFLSWLTRFQRFDESKDEWDKWAGWRLRIVAVRVQGNHVGGIPDCLKEVFV